MNKQISSFNNIQITKNKTLVICDIDNTVLYYPECINKCLEIMKDFNDCFTKEKFNKEFNYFCNIYKTINKPTHTDYDGYVNMVNKIKENNGKLLFLTARNNSCNDATKKQLLHVGIFLRKLRKITLNLH